jgi:glycosyltransferase involved in cell wall biosynthesis
MKRETPFFSVVTPSYNQSRWIEGCIESVRSQGGQDYEHIIFDNCSKDGTAEIAARYPKVQWHIEPDRGQSHAINKAISRARGKVLCWLNADDQYLPGAFEIVRREFSKPEVDVIYGDAKEIYFDGRPESIRRARFERREDLLFWWEKRTDLLQPAVFFRRALLEKTGPLREDLHMIMDTELWWRLSERSRFHYVPHPLALQQRQPDSKTIRQTERIYEEKAQVFGPLLDAAFPGKRLAHGMARRRIMGRRYLGLAQSAGGTNFSVASGFLRRSAQENPFLLLTPRWWKALVFGYSQRNHNHEEAPRGQSVAGNTQTH